MIWDQYWNSAMTREEQKNYRNRLDKNQKTEYENKSIKLVKEMIKALAKFVDTEKAWTLWDIKGLPAFEELLKTRGTKMEILNERELQIKEASEQLDQEEYNSWLDAFNAKERE